MTPTQVQTVLDAIFARRQALRDVWSPELVDDLRREMARLNIDSDQGIAAAAHVILHHKSQPTPGHFLEAFKNAEGQRQESETNVTLTAAEAAALARLSQDPGALSLAVQAFKATDGRLRHWEDAWFLDFKDRHKAYWARAFLRWTVQR